MTPPRSPGPTPASSSFSFRDHLEDLVDDLQVAVAERARAAGPTESGWVVPEDRRGLVATRLGDALRAGISLPRPVLADLAKSGVLGAIFAEAAAEPPTWELAWLGPPLADGLGEHLLVRRDELASLVALGRRVWFADPACASPPGLDDLVGALQAVDAHLRTVLSPMTVGEALAHRPLDDIWYRDFVGAEPDAHGEEPDERAGTADFEAALAAEAAAWSEDDPARLEAYIASGAKRALVEAWAGRADEHTERLLDAIDHALDRDRPVSFVARLWRRAQARQTSILVVPPPALAAADGDDEDALGQTLGSFGPIAAEGVLEISSHTFTLVVFEETPGAVTAIALGDYHASAPTPQGVWRVSHPREGALSALRIRVWGGGHTVDESLPLEPGPGSVAAR